MSAIPLSRAIDYPESDGRPMAETQVHGQVQVDLLNVFRKRYAEVPNVYVWGNLLLYYVEGDPRACVAPDLFLVKGVDKRVRPVYKLWEEGRAPSLVIEVTSKSTRSEDLRTKKRVYQRLGVDEYFLFDPLGEYLHPRLQGFRLVQGHYEAMDADADLSLLSRTTGLRLLPEGDRLRLRDAATGEPLLWDDEEEERRRAAEARVQELEEELARLRRDAR